MHQPGHHWKATWLWGPGPGATRKDRSSSRPLAPSAVCEGSLTLWRGLGAQRVPRPSHHSALNKYSVPPSNPDCGIQGETVIGNDIQLTCESKEGSPAPQYSWKSYDVLNQERHQVTPVTGQIFSLKNISTEMSGYYVCTSSNEVGIRSCNITLAVRPPSMNVALYAGIAGGVAAALIIIGVIVYCCCCRETSKAEDAEVARPNRAAYQEPPEQMIELSRERQEEGEDGYRDEDPSDPDQESPDQAGQ